MRNEIKGWKTNKKERAIASHFLSRNLSGLHHPTFGTSAKPHKPMQNQSFAKEPKFASLYLFWRFFDFQIKPVFTIFGKNWVQYA